MIDSVLLTVAVVFPRALTPMQCGYGHRSVTNAGILVNTAVAMTVKAGLLPFEWRGLATTTMVRPSNTIGKLPYFEQTPV